MTRDERSDNEEEEDEEEDDDDGRSLTEEEEGEQRVGNGVGVCIKDGKNGCFGRLSLSENTCQSKTVY